MYLRANPSHYSCGTHNNHLHQCSWHEPNYDIEGIAPSPLRMIRRKRGKPLSDNCQCSQLHSACGFCESVSMEQISLEQFSCLCCWPYSWIHLLTVYCPASSLHLSRIVSSWCAPLPQPVRFLLVCRLVSMIFHAFHLASGL